ncbi:DinB family protein [Oceanobacillus kimchii]|uniref:DinB family protein n=1 Tax=Oceanobacillus kimchii TaxID=746691 RepID=UPI00098797B3|nr:DinB family protein [Oceanobacillus kimchii]
MNLLLEQYQWVQKTREILFKYCETISFEDYKVEIDGDSICSLHAHVADCYHVWLGNRAMGKSLPSIDGASIQDVKDMRKVYTETDRLVEQFLTEFNENWDKEIPVIFRNEDKATFTTLWLYTHTVTHEFHHKGQIVKLGRRLGYIPPDTDLIEK